MANIKKLLPQNMGGEFFVNSTCVNCDTCRQLAPAMFGDTGDYAYARAQPATEEERWNALRALLCSPGHGHLVCLPADEMAHDTSGLAQRM